MRSSETIPTPSLISFILLPIAYFLSAKACLSLATSSEGLAIFWFPNAFILATLLFYRGQRYWLFMLLVIGAEIASHLPRFPWYESLMLGAANIAEATVAFLIMHKSGISRKIDHLEDVVQFSVAGPLIGSLLGGLIGAATVKLFDGNAGSFLSIAQLWWFSDALGLMILTPLLLAFLYPKKQAIRPFHYVDLLVIVITLVLVGMIFKARNGFIHEVFITPALLVPSMLYLAARTDLKWTAIGVCIVTSAVAVLIALGSQPFGDIPLSLTIVNAQEYIFTVCIASMGLATLICHIRDNEIHLETRVSERTEQLRILNQELEALSVTDSLTGIANRRRFDEQLQIEWARALRADEPLALVLIDIDWFKRYNDHYGHQAGDECLRQVAAILASNINRSTDLLARYGGEEFVFIIPATAIDPAMAIANKVCEAFNKFKKLPHKLSAYGYVTVSVGVASRIPQKEDKPYSLLKAADEALYRAKGQGRNQVVAAEI